MEQLVKFMQYLGMVLESGVVMAGWDIGCTSSYQWGAIGIVIIISLIIIWGRMKNRLIHRDDDAYQRGLNINTLQQLIFIIGVYVFISLIKILCLNKFNKIASILLGLVLYCLGWFLMSLFFFSRMGRPG